MTIFIWGLIWGAVAMYASMHNVIQGLREENASLRVLLRQEVQS